MVALNLLGAVAMVAVTALGPTPRSSTVDLLPADCVPASDTVIAQLPWAQDWLRPQRVWPLTEGAGILVAVLDTGVDAGVPQLAGRVDAGRDLLAAAGARADSDCAGHGTFAAGIVAAAPVAGVGFAGLAPRAQILPLRVSLNPAEATPPAALAAAIRAAAEQAAKIIVVGTPVVRAGADLRAAIEFAVQHDALVVVAAGKPHEGDPPVDPDIAGSVLSVGGFGANGAPLSDTAAPVDLLAPGGDLISVGPRGNGHLNAGGSGYAASFVAGAAALVRAAWPKLTATQVRHRLIATADQVARPLPDPTLGWGALDLYAAVTAILPEERPGWRPVHVAGPPATIDRPQATGTAATTLAGWAVAVAAALALGVIAVALLAPRARRRGWRPAGR